MLRLLTRRCLFFALADPPVAPPEVTEVRLGEETVRIARTTVPPRGLAFVSVHENEQTAVESARAFLNRRGGRLIELRSRRRRTLTFRLDGRRYEVDPNRIFTDPGLEKSLHLYGAWSAAAHEAVAGLRKALLSQLLAQPGPVVAVHNNARNGLSVTTYSPGGELAAQAAHVAVNRRINPHDFFLVLDTPLFERLAAAAFNVVLQSPAPADDGSMSVFFASQRLPYVNIEAGYGRTAEQLRMIESLAHLLLPAAAPAKSR